MDFNEKQPLDYKMHLRTIKGYSVEQTQKVTYDDGFKDKEYLHYLEEWYSDHDRETEGA